MAFRHLYDGTEIGDMADLEALGLLDPQGPPRRYMGAGVDGLGFFWIGQGIQKAKTKKAARDAQKKGAAMQREFEAKKKAEEDKRKRIHNERINATRVATDRRKKAEAEAAKAAEAAEKARVALQEAEAARAAKDKDAWDRKMAEAKIEAEKARVASRASMVAAGYDPASIVAIETAGAAGEAAEGYMSADGEDDGRYNPDDDPTARYVEDDGEFGLEGLGGIERMPPDLLAYLTSPASGAGGRILLAYAKGEPTDPAKEVRAYQLLPPNLKQQFGDFIRANPPPVAALTAAQAAELAASAQGKAAAEGKGAALSTTGFDAARGALDAQGAGPWGALGAAVEWVKAHGSQVVIGLGIVIVGGTVLKFIPAPRVRNPRRRRRA